jgi:Family of unknown function (DUF6463)
MAATRSTSAGATPLARPVVGAVLVVVGIVHTLAVPLFYGDGLDGIVNAGVVNGVERDASGLAERSAAFWYVSAGIALVLLGVLVGWIERRLGHTPAMVGWLLVILAVWGVVLIPASPFWVFGLAAVLAFRSARRSGGPA